MRLITFSVTGLAAIWMSSAIADHQESFLLEATGQFSNMYQLAAGTGAASAPAIRMDVTSFQDSGTDWLEVVHRDIRSEEVILRHQLFKLVNEDSDDGFSTTVYYVPVARVHDNSDEIAHVLYSASDESIDTWLEEKGAYELQGCDIQWSSQGNRFYGVRNSESCFFYDPAGERISLTSSLELSEQGWSIQDTALTLDSEFVPASVTGDTIEFRRITFFEAEIEFTPPGLDEAVVVSLGQDLHDHGQQVQLYSDGKALPFRLSIVRESADTLRVQVYNRSSSEPVEREAVTSENGRWKVEAGDLSMLLVAKETLAEE